MGDIPSERTCMTVQLPTVDQSTTRDNLQLRHECKLGLCIFEDIASMFVSLIKPNLIKGNAYEAQQSSLFFVFVRFFGLGRAQSIISFELCPRVN